MAPLYFPANGRAHLGIRGGLAFGAQASGDFLDPGGWKKGRGAQQDPVRDLFHEELSAGPPGPGEADVQGKDDLPFGGEPGREHR